MKNRNKVSLCKGDVCVNAEGSNAKAIAGAATFAFVCAGFAALVRALR